MILQWMTRVLHLVVGRPLYNHEYADVSFVNSSVELWDVFVESTAVTALLFEDKSRISGETTKEVWQEQLRIAFRLCRDMDREDGRLDMRKIMPALSRLIVGTYFSEQSLVLAEQHDMDVNHQSLLLHALIGITVSLSCPTCIFDWIVETLPEQLRIVNPITGQLPLAAACSSPRCTPHQLVTILDAYPDAAATPDATGSYPLHLACQNGNLTWESGIRHVFSAAPHVLLRLSTTNGHCLFVATALAHAEGTLTVPSLLQNDVDFRNTLFELLRCDPTVVRHVVAAGE